MSQLRMRPFFAGVVWPLLLAITTCVHDGAPSGRKAGRRQIAIQYGGASAMRLSKPDLHSDTPNDHVESSVETYWERSDGMRPTRKEEDAKVSLAQLLMSRDIFKDHLNHLGVRLKNHVGVAFGIVLAVLMTCIVLGAIKYSASGMDDAAAPEDQADQGKGSGDERDRLSSGDGTGSSIGDDPRLFKGKRPLKVTTK